VKPIRLDLGKLGIESPVSDFFFAPACHSNTHVNTIGFFAEIARRLGRCQSFFFIPEVTNLRKACGSDLKPFRQYGLNFDEYVISSLAERPGV